MNESINLSINPLIDYTHFETAIYESNVSTGEVKTSLNLSDGALHVGSRQSHGKTGEGQRHNEQLENTRQLISNHFLYTVNVYFFNFLISHISSCVYVNFEVLSQPLIK